MKESYWGYWLIVLGVFVILVMLLVQNVTATNTQDYYLAKEVAEASMIDAIDYGYYREYGEVRIVKEKFIESFVRRFAESASPTSTYKIEFYDIYEAPPKVSIKVSTDSSSININGDSDTFKITNKVDMVLETDPSFKSPKIDEKNMEAGGSYIKSIPGTSSITVSTKINNSTVNYVHNDKTGQLNKTCTEYTATFDKNGATSIGYAGYKCKAVDGKCYIYLPGIYKDKGNVYGWSTNPNASPTSVYKVGSKVQISKDTTFYAITDSNNPSKAITIPSA